MRDKGWFEIFHVWRKKHMNDRNYILVLCVVIGVLAAVAAVILKTAVHYFEGWVRSISGTYNENWLFFIFPLIGIIVTVFYVKKGVRDDISHGVSRILYAISRNKGLMKLHNTYSSIVACAFTSGFGGSVGMEAPIVSTGAAIGSNVARSARFGFKRTIMLIGCGAAAAIAAIFKAPIAGLIFALEVLRLDLTLSSIIPLLIATVTGTIFSVIFLGEQIEFYFTLQDPFNFSNIFFYVLLGVVTGLVSLYFTWINEKIESRFKKIKKTHTRVLVGGLLVGLLIFLFPPLFGEGYTAMRSLLSGNPHQLLEESIFNYLFDSTGWLFLGFLVFVLLFKAVATSITLGSGGVGGVFAPSLFMGGITGFIFAKFLNNFSWISISERNFALVGMAGLIAGVIHAPLTAIFLIAEITGGYELFIALIITASISYMTVVYFQPHSLYTKKLAQKGQLITHHKDKAVLTLLKVENVVETDMTTVHPDQTLGDLVKVIEKSHRNIFPVVDEDNNYLGHIPLDEVREVMFDKSKYDLLKMRNLMILPPETVSFKDNMDKVMKKFKDTGKWNLPVVEKGKYIGFISRANVFNIYRRMLIEFSDE